MPKTHKEDKLGYSLGGFILFYFFCATTTESRSAIGFCGEVVFITRGIIVFSQFIVNSSFGYNLSVVISILL